MVEDLYKIKQPMIDQEAVYLMAPTDENIGFLKRDFEKKKREPPPPELPSLTSLYIADADVMSPSSVGGCSGTPHRTHRWTPLPMSHREHAC